MSPHTITTTSAFHTGLSIADRWRQEHDRRRVELPAGEPAETPTAPSSKSPTEAALTSGTASLRPPATPPTPEQVTLAMSVHTALQGLLLGVR